MSQPPTMVIAPQRQAYKRAHFIMTGICALIEAYEFREYFSVKDIIAELPGADVGAQTSTRIAFLAVTIAIMIASLAVIVMGIASVRNAKFAIKPRNEAIYYVICAGLLIIISISLVVRYSQLMDLGIRSNYMISAAVWGFLDAVVYLVPAGKIWMAN